MFSLHKNLGHVATFHFDSDGQTPRRWHTLELPTGRIGFCTDMGTKGDRQPGIPERLRNKSFKSIDDAIKAVLALNT